MITLLPENISCTILSEWLTANDVLRLDGAHINKQARHKWLSLLSADGTMIRSFQRMSSPLWERAFPWIVARQIKFGYLELDLQRFHRHCNGDKFGKPFTDMIAFVTELHINVMNAVYSAPQVFTAVRNACPRLRKLILDGETLTPEQICAIISPTTVSLEIRGCTIMSGIYDTQPVFSATGLQCLVLRNARQCELLTDSLLQSGCPALENLHTCGSINLGVAERLTQVCMRLKRLEFAPSMQDEGVVRLILARCPELRALSILNGREITADTVRAIAECGRALRMLSLNHIRRGVLDDPTIRLLADGIGANLSVLEFNHCDLSISHETAVYLLRRCPQLRGLRCANGRSVLLGTENGTELQEQLALCSQVRELEGCASTDAALKLVVRHCPYLTHLALDVNVAGGEKARQFLGRCRNLRTVAAPVSGKQQGFSHLILEALIRRFYPHIKRVESSEHLPMWEEWVGARNFL